MAVSVGDPLRDVEAESVKLRLVVAVGESLADCVDESVAMESDTVGVLEALPVSAGVIVSEALSDVVDVSLLVRT